MFPIWYRDSEEEFLTTTAQGWEALSSLGHRGSFSQAGSAWEGKGRPKRLPACLSMEGFFLHSVPHPVLLVTK